VTPGHTNATIPMMTLTMPRVRTVDPIPIETSGAS
jgi:hypothetical protein